MYTFYTEERALREALYPSFVQIFYPQRLFSLIRVKVSCFGQEIRRCSHSKRHFFFLLLAYHIELKKLLHVSFDVKIQQQQFE